MLPLRCPRCALVTTLLVLAPLAAEAGPDAQPGPAEAPDVAETSERGPFSVHVLVGHVGDLGLDPALPRRGEGTGHPIVGFKESVALEVGGTFRGRLGDDWALPGERVALWTRVAYHTFAVDFGIPFVDLFESPSRSVQLGTGRHHMIKLGIGLMFSREEPFRFNYAAGFVVGVCRYSNLRVSPVGATTVGVESVSSEGGLLYGVEAEATLPIGRTGLLLGVSSSVMGIRSGVDVAIEMAEDSIFGSGTTGISPLTVAAFLEYRLAG